MVNPDGLEDAELYAAVMQGLARCRDGTVIEVGEVDRAQQVKDLMDRVADLIERVADLIESEHE
jgi:hypothetical protein